MTHDLRSPIGAIGIFCELLLMGDKSLDESQQRSVQMIAEAAGKAQRILEDASEVSRIYRGGLQLARNSVNLRNIVMEAITLAEPAAEGRAVSLSSSFSPGDYTVMADAGRVLSIILRLIEEAVALSLEAQDVTISATLSDSGTVRMTVAMAGNERPGMRARREKDTSLKGRLANRKTGESHYSLHVASRVAKLMGGTLEYNESGPFQAVLQFPRTYA